MLAVTACLAGGAMDVLVAKCSDLGQVSASVLCNWSAICGLFIAIIYGLLEEKSNGRSSGGLGKEVNSR